MSDNDRASALSPSPSPSPSPPASPRGVLDSMSIPPTLTPQASVTPLTSLTSLTSAPSTTLAPWAPSSEAKSTFGALSRIAPWLSILGHKLAPSGSSSGSGLSSARSTILFSRLTRLLVHLFKLLPADSDVCQFPVCF